MSYDFFSIELFDFAGFAKSVLVINDAADNVIQSTKYVWVERIHRKSSVLHFSYLNTLYMYIYIYKYIHFICCVSTIINI